MNPRYSHRHPFTLIELLVTLIIVLVLLGLSVGTYRSVSRAQLTDNAAKDIDAVVTLGRLTAVAKSRYVACIFPGDISSLNLRHRFSTYRLAYVDKLSTSYVFAGWVENSAWAYTPNGALIMEVDSDIGIQDDSGYAAIPEDNGETVVADVDLAETLGGGGSVGNVRAVVFAPNGQVKGGSRFITIGRSRFDGTNWLIDPEDRGAIATNLSAADQITLVLNRFTGRVSYVHPEDY